MKKDNRNLIYVWYFAACLPLIAALITIYRKDLIGTCIKTNNFRHQKGLFCDIGPKLGEALFGIGFGYLGVAILLILVSICAILFGNWMMKK